MNKKLLSALLVFMLLGSALFSQTFPAGFSQVRIAALTEATAMRFAPDGRIFVCQRDGTVLIIKNGTLLTTPFVKLTTDQNGERGISGICFDPNFSSNHYVYIYYTATTPTIHNRLSRFTASGDVAVAGSEFQLLNAEPVGSIFHNGGGLDFGIDGKLYLSMGEDNNPSNAQNLATYKGKLLRMNSDGSAPTDNPYSNSTNDATRKVWCLGLRNPYTLCIQPGTGRIFINNVGSDYWEEIHDGTSSLKNFGWPFVEGYGTDPAYTDPIFAYPHSATGQHGCAITGGAFFNPVSTNYPGQYIGKYFYQEFCNGWIYYLTPGTTSYTNNTVFATGLTTQNLALQVGTDGNLYYLNRHSPEAGVYKIIYNNANAPTITSQPVSKTVSAGQPVSFSVSVTGTAPISYQWKKNGTNISGANSATYSIASTTGTDAGSYSVSVSNSYGSILSNSATLTITAHNDPPHATIMTPPAGTHYRAGQVITFSGDATDTEDGTLAASQFEWTVEFWHNNNHFHPGPYIPTGIKAGSFTIPNTGETSPVVFYRLRLKVTDSNGLIDTPHVDILPVLSTTTLQTSPSGLQIQLDGQPHATPYSTQAVSGMVRTLSAPSPQTLGGISYNFDHWSDSGAATHNFTVTDANQTFTAVYVAAGPSSCTASGSITRDFWSPVSGSTISSVPVNTTPTSTMSLSAFEGPSYAGDYYASRIRGYICPPVTGDYVFWIASDNAGALYLSTDDQPANKVKIAYVDTWTNVREWTKFPSQQSAAIHLVAGTKYYIEALQKEESQGDNLAVGWQIPGGALERPIPGSRLSPFTSSGPVPLVSITSPTNGQTFSTPSNIPMYANASVSSGSITKVEFYNSNSKIGEALSAPYKFVWMNITTGNYSIHAKAITNTGATAVSSNITVKVASCATPVITASGPTKICSGTVTLNTTIVSGGSYQWIKNGVNITGATGSSYTAGVSGDYQVKVIQGSCISWSAPTTVTIGATALSASITPGGPTSFCAGKSVNLYANTCTGYTYQWIRGGVNIAGATGAMYTATQGGSYQVMVTLSGAHAWSDLLTVTVKACLAPDSSGTVAQEEPNRVLETASADSTKPFEMKVFPNPNNGQFTISLNMPTTREEKITMRMINLLGQEVYNKEIVANGEMISETVELDGSLTTGVYTLQVMFGNRLESINVVLSR